MGCLGLCERNGTVECVTAGLLGLCEGREL